MVLCGCHQSEVVAVKCDGKDLPFSAYFAPLIDESITTAVCGLEDGRYCMNSAPSVSSLLQDLYNKRWTECE